MDYCILKSNYDIDKLLIDLKIAYDLHDFINPKKFNNSFSISDKTYGWEALPLHTLNGTIGNKATIPIEIKKNTVYKPNYILKQCKYIQKILNDLNTEIYLVRIMKLKKNGFIAPHKDKFIDNKNVIRCQLPLISNDDIDFIINKKIYHLEIGNLYYINVLKDHSVKNNSNYDRISLIIDLKPTKSLLEIINN